MRAVDTVVLAALEATGVNIHDGLVDVDNSTNVVTYELPYAVFYSSIGADDNRRLAGRKTRRSVFFRVICVGADRNQTKWAAERVRGALQGQRFEIPGHKTWPCEFQDEAGSFMIRRDDDAIRPDGSPLFYSSDGFAISITLSEF